MRFEKLGNIASIQIGKTPKRDNASWWGKGNLWVSISDLKEKIITKTKEEITELAIKECGCKRITKGTLLMSFKLSIGKVAFAGCDLYTNEAICGLVIKDKNKIFPEYLYYVLKHTKFQGSNVAVKGATLNTASLKEIKIPKIPLEDQIRIATLLSKAEALIKQRKESIDLLDEYLKSTFLEMFGDPVRNEKKFPVKKLSEFYITPKEGTKCGPFGSALKKEDYKLTGIPVWNMDNISKKGDFVEEINLWIDDNKYNQLTGYATQNGDVIISRAGTVGKMCVLNSKYDKSIISTNLIRVRFDNTLLPLYFVSLMTYFKDKVGRLQTGAEGTFTHMNTGVLNELKFPYPPQNLQTKFANIVEKIETLKAQYKSSLAELENLYGSLSQKAFKGELNLEKGEEMLMAAEPMVGYGKKDN